MTPAGADLGEPVALPLLRPGLCATILRIDAADDATASLMAMGVCAGRKVELVKAGDPLILRVLGSRIGVSARLAKKVVVAPCTAPACQPPVHSSKHD
ncbi:MAG: FeoA family protein [Phycisphaeraceae bacterium]